MFFKTRLEKVLAIALTVSLIVTGILLVASYRIHSVGKIKAIGVDVFWDQQCIQPCEEINWGTMNPGDLAGVTLYIKNVKNTNFTLTFNTSDWNPPEIEQHFTLDWNYSGQTIQPNQVIPTQITLHLSLTVEGYDQFSFDLWIIATEA